MTRKKYKPRENKKISHRKEPAMLNQHGGAHKVRRNELKEKALDEEMEEELKSLNDDNEFEDILDDPELPNLEEK